MPSENTWAIISSTACASSGSCPKGQVRGDVEGDAADSDPCFSPFNRELRMRSVRLRFSHGHRLAFRFFVQ